MVKIKYKVAQKNDHPEEKGHDSCVQQKHLFRKTKKMQ